ncbi:MAG: NAD-dependent deacylase [Planctomycetia bacterium]|nr:NAD-dependent deacylase [Planctomycetia bacterium]
MTGTATAHETLARWLAEARSAVAFTGAGISTESGIPDFRSPGGIWTRYRVIMYQEFMSDPEARHEYWRQKAEGQLEFAGARPNAGHEALARWEDQRRLVGVITQNIDGLHQAAGSRRVLELHGTALATECQDCRARFDVAPLVERFRRTNVVPPCPKCGGDRLKHATISFGQALPPAVLQDSFQLARQADLLLAIGSSLVVEPAASIPRTAKEHGARLVIVNRDATPLDAAADLVISESIGETLAAVDRCLAAAKT